MRYLLGFIVAVVLSGVLWLSFFYSELRVDLDHVIDYKPKLSTEFYDVNGELVANIFDGQNRKYAHYNEIPPRMIEALIAVEDTAFFEHDGVNLEAIFRAVIKDIQSMSLREGASTITQQLIKNMVLTRERKFSRKLKEVILAYQIERKLNKEQILERYLNEVYLGHGYYGVKTAAQGYFKKSLDALSLKEIAILVGLPKAPSNYDPTRHLDLSIARANAVITRLKDLGWISKDEYISAINELPVVYDETLTQNKAPYVIDEAIKQLSTIYPDIKSGGYKVNLTIDLRLQNVAQNALQMGYDEILKRDNNASMDKLNGAILVTNPQTGQILAMLGGIDYAKSNYNRVTQSTRQPGSSFKPFVYQIALNSGYSPASKVADVAMAFDGVGDDKKAWKPKNYAKDFAGFISLKEALTKSRNLATISLLVDVGFDNVWKKLGEFGFKNIPPNLSIALGSFGISMIDYSELYSVFAGLGRISKPYLINQITDRYGQSKEFKPSFREIEPAKQAYLMIDMMRSVVTSGTARRARIEGVEVAGKTGTTNNNIDAWFCGFSPDMQAIIWYGNEDNTPMRKIEGGGLTAAPVFAAFGREYFKIYPDAKKEFDVPSGVESDDGVLHTNISRLPSNKTDNALQTQEEEGLIFDLAYNKAHF